MKTIKLNQITILLLFVSALVYQTHGKCQNMLQKSGECTKCPSSKFKYKGDCYNKIRGCEDYFSDKICLSCQSGYVFNQGACIKQAIFYKIQKKDIPPVKINIQGSLTFSDIDQRIGQSRKQMFELINRHFKQKYVKNLNACAITNVKYIQTINGVIFTIYYRSLMSIYEAIAFIDSKRDSKRKKTIIQLGFQQKNSIPNYSLQQIHSGITKKYQQPLKNCLLSSVQKIETNKYKFNYINSKGQKYECYVKRQPFEQVQDLKTIVNEVDLEDILIYVFNMYPQLKQLDFEIVSAPYFENKTEIEGVYVIVFDQKYQIRVQNKKQAFNLLSYKNLQVQKQQSVQKKQITKAQQQLLKAEKQRQTYKPFEDLTDPVFLQVWRYFITEYPKYQSYEISAVEHKKIEGTRFLIKAKSPKNIIPLQNIKLTIYYSLNSPIQLEQFQIDGQVINFVLSNYKEEKDKSKALDKIVKTNSDVIKAYDFRSDGEFTDAYRYMLGKIKIVNVIPIVAVNRVQTQEHIDYDIIYSDKEKSKIRKVKSLKQEHNGKNLRKVEDERSDIQILYYIADGKDLISGKDVIEQSQDNIRNGIIRFIVSQKPQIFGTNYLVESYSDTQQNNKKQFTVSLLTQSGSYKVIVQVKQNQNLKMTSLVNLSPDNCYQFIQSDLNNTSSENQFTKIDNFLKNNYGLSGAIFQLVQSQITQKTKRFRVLYTDNQKRKLDILLENYQGKYIVIDSYVLEEGYMPIDQADKKVAEIQGLSKAHYTEFISNCEIRLRLTNITHYKFIYSCKSKAFEYVYNSINQTDKLQIIFKRSQTQERQVSINKDKVVSLKQIVHDSKFVQIDQLSRQKFSQYIQRSQVTQVQKDEIAGVQGNIFYLYKLYYKTSLGGHYVCQTSWSEGQIKILNFYLATFQMNTNCQVLSEQDNANKECIKCLSGYSLDNGKCYQTIQYCEVQTGNICVRCDRKSILKEEKCVRSCKNIFSMRTIKEKEM